MSYPSWQKKQSNVDRTNAVIKKIAARYAGNPAVVPIIAPLNEPAGFDSDVLPVATQYWYDSYNSIRKPYGNTTKSSTYVDRFLFHPILKTFFP